MIIFATHILKRIKLFFILKKTYFFTFRLIMILFTFFLSKNAMIGWLSRYRQGHEEFQQRHTPLFGETERRECLPVRFVLHFFASIFVFYVHARQFHHFKLFEKHISGDKFHRAAQGWKDDREPDARGQICLHDSVLVLS